MKTDDKQHHNTVEEAHERAQDDVRMGKQADVEAAGQAQLEAERKSTSQDQAQAREAGAAKAAAEAQADLLPTENKNEGWQGLAADGHPEQANRQLHQQHLKPREGSDEKETEEAYEYPVTEQRMDALASAATPDSPEARENEAGMTDNISVHGAYSDNPDEVDQVSGPPMESISKDKVEKK